MKLGYVSLCGFRGFFEATRIDIPAGFAIIVGPNGAGKSTVCDAVEFVLTGGIRASSEHKEKGESIGDYLWWRGAKTAQDYYVEVGFVLPDGGTVTARRTPNGLTVTPSTTLQQLLLLGSPALENPIAQLCRTAILRDEEITRLSVDLRETDTRDASSIVAASSFFAALSIDCSCATSPRN
jgi:chromosome segregation protein